MYIYIDVIPRPRVDNQSGDENPCLYSQQNNYITQVKLGSSIKVAQESASFSNVVAPLVYSSNQCHMFLRSQHRVTNYKAQSCANSHRNDSCVATILGKWKLYISCVVSVTEMMNATFSESSVTVQSSLLNRDGPALLQRSTGWRGQGSVWWIAPGHSYMYVLSKQKSNDRLVCSGQLRQAHRFREPKMELNCYRRRLQYLR